MVIVDTNVISESLKSAPDSQVMQWLTVQSYHVPAVVLAELWAGADILPPGKRQQSLYVVLGQMAARLALLDRLLPVTANVARAYGQVIARRRTQGLMMTAMDALIAATAMRHGASLATRNIKDFAGLDITLINPWTAL
jgi:toxin FitB